MKHDYKTEFPRPRRAVDRRWIGSEPRGWCPSDPHHLWGTI